MSKATVEKVYEEIEKWGDRPEEFLSAMQKEYPPLVHILSRKQVKLLAKSPREPYPTGETNVNEEFISDMMAYYRARLGVKEAKKGLHVDLMSTVTSDKSILVKKTTAPIFVLEKVRTRSR